MKLPLGLALPVSLLLAACNAQLASTAPGVGTAVPDRTIFVTRHMQKAEGSDPPLSAEGSAAAERLASALAGKGVTAIFATQTRRAMETAAPLAKRMDLPITPYDPQDPQALVSMVASRTGSVLIVGHSNTVHDLIERLGGTPLAPLSEQDHGRVFAIDADGDVTETTVS